MSFFLFALAGFISGLFGGMGMGGGTILIPALTVFLGVEQHIAQATNLIAFLPMALLSLYMHKKSGLIETKGVLPVVLPALLTSVVGGIIAAFLPSSVLRKLFGVFLVLLAVKGIVGFLSAK